MPCVVLWWCRLIIDSLMEYEDDDEYAVTIKHWLIVVKVGL
jgi:hypothetical protein